MARPAFAKLPSAWARKKSDPVSAPTLATTAQPGPVGLDILKWSVHKGHATAALLVLFALAIISNQFQRRNGLRQDDLVHATYEDIQAVAPLSRKLVSEGLKLLHELEAINSEKRGNKKVYKLNGINEGGKWCELPQQHLLDRSDHMQRLSMFIAQIKRPTSLHAMKLYMLLLAFRRNNQNVTRISYETITEYTSMRREEISVAIQLLVAAQLCRIATDEDIERRDGDRSHNRYLMTGLTAS